MAGRRSLGDMFSYLRDADAHPPLDYLLRDPLARAGASAFVFRAPSLVFSVGALALFAWWMRTRAVAGVVATALFALSGFAVAYGSEARMYALLQLLGVAAAMTAESWLRAPRRRHAVLIGVVVLVGCLDHTSMFLLGGALLVLAGWRRDRASVGVARRHRGCRHRVGAALGLHLPDPAPSPALVVDPAHDCPWRPRWRHEHGHVHRRGRHPRRRGHRRRCRGAHRSATGPGSASGASAVHCRSQQLQ